MSDRRTPAGPPPLHPWGPRASFGRRCVSKSRIRLNRLPSRRRSTKAALRQCRALRRWLVAWIPFTPRATGLSGPPAGIVSRLSAGVAKTRRNKAARCRSKEGRGHESLLVGSIERNRRTSAKRLTTEARASPAFEGWAEGHACWQPFRTERCSKKGFIFPRTSFC